MVRLTRIYTRGGDRGETSLGNGERVPKHHARIEAIGAVDEANAQIGVARRFTAGEADVMLTRIQNELFDLGADLCVPEDGARAAGALRVSLNQVERLEREMDALNADMAALESFVLPGGSDASAALHVARTAVRRAERAVAHLAAQEPVSDTAIAYINRLSDHLFVLARHLNDQGRADVLWRPGETR
jgi:cob(I)alamin adenosyltransferase